MEESIFGPHVKFETINVNVYAEPGGAGRSPGDVGKIHLDAKLLFANLDDLRRWMTQNGIPLTIFEQEVPDGR